MKTIRSMILVSEDEKSNRLGGRELFQSLQAALQEFDLQEEVAISTITDLGRQDALPMVVVYKVSPLSYWVGRAFIHVDHISLVNIIAGKTVVPELIQGEAQANRMAVEVIDILSRKSRKLRMHEELSQIRDRLGEPGAAAKTAALAMSLLNA